MYGLKKAAFHVVCQKAPAGLSESTCPEVFKVKAEGSTVVIKGVDYSGLEEKIKMAADLCPVAVIKYDEDDDVLAEMFAYDDGASNEAT